MKKINKLIFKHILNFYVIMGLFLISFVLYRMFFRYLFNFKFNLFYFKFIILFSFSLHLLYFFRNINLSLIKNLNFYINQLFELIYWKPLNSVYEHLFKFIPNIGKFLFSISKRFVNISCKLHPNSTIKLCFSFYIFPHLILSSSIIYNIFYNTNIYLYICIPICIFFLRFTSLFIYILNDFAIKNKEALDLLLVITKIEKSYKYEFNYKNIKGPSQQKLELYSSRYEHFRILEIFTAAFMFYKKNEISFKFKAYLTTIYFVCFTKILLILFNINIHSFFLIIFFIFFLSLEYYNLSK